MTHSHSGHDHGHDHDHHAPNRFKEFKTYVREEFIAHLPFTLVGMATGLALVFLAICQSIRIGEEEFHTAHFFHIFFSAAAGSAIFRSYREPLWKGMLVVFPSSVALCTLSDSLIPFTGLWVFGKGPHIHICVLEHPASVAIFAAVGFVAGRIGIRFFRHCNRPLHLMHILIATLASVLYMIGFAESLVFSDIAALLLILFFSLVVPCLVGDVALPLCFVNLREEYLHEKVHHSK